LDFFGLPGFRLRLLICRTSFAISASASTLRARRIFARANRWVRLVSGTDVALFQKTFFRK
jgi:hypothetical protein